jgi:hypothetical protein
MSGESDSDSMGDATTKLNMAPARSQPTTQTLCHAASPQTNNLAFPNHRSPPTAQSQLLKDSPISPNILVKFSPPARNATLWHRRETTSLVSMPEAPMHKNHGLITRQHYVRPAWKFPHVESKPEPQMMKRLAHSNFRFGVPTAYLGHHQRARRLIDDVSHRYRIRLQLGGSTADIFGKQE